MLRDFGVRPTTIRFPDGLAKGYLRAEFEDVFARYLSNPVTAVTEVTIQAVQPVAIARAA